MKRALACIMMLWVHSWAHAVDVRWTGALPSDAFTIGAQLTASSDAGPNDLRNLAQSLLAARSYYWPDIRLQQDRLEIAAGVRGRPGSVSILGLSRDTAAIADAFKAAVSGTMTEPALQAGVMAVVQSLVEVGYPYAQVRLLELDVTQPPFVNVTLRAYPGSRVFTGDLITNAERTRANVFTRESGWQRGRVLTDAEIQNASKSLQALPFVTRTDTALLLAVTADTADLLVQVKEAAGVRVGGLAGWVPGNDVGQKGYWGGKFELDLLSPFGAGRAVSLNASRRDPQSRRTGLTYWEPWPWGAPVWIGVALDQDDFGTDFIETEVSLRLRLARLSPRWEMHLATGRVTIEEDPSPGTFSGERYEAGVTVSDSSFGSSYRFGVRWNRQRLDPRPGASPPQSSIQYTRAEFGVTRWFELGRSLMLRAQSDGAGSLTGSEFAPPNLLHRVGGLQTLRGYREEEFLVRDYLRSGVEWHFGSRHQSLFVFVESAWLRFRSGQDRVVGSSGVGLRIGSGLQLLWAVPTEGGANASKIHIGLSTSR